MVVRAFTSRDGGGVRGRVRGRVKGRARARARGILDRKSTLNSSHT